jgi:hypothetical protein
MQYKYLVLGERTLFHLNFKTIQHKMKGYFIFICKYTESSKLGNVRVSGGIQAHLWLSKLGVDTSIGWE